MKYIILIIFVAVFYSCEKQSKSLPSENFTFLTYSIDVDTSIYTAILYRDNFYCLSEKNRFFCLNKNFKIESEITNLINQQHFDYSYLSGDTLIAVQGLYFSQGAKCFFLNDSLKWEELTTIRKPNPFYEDSNFVVHECCMGEFGGSVFFTDKIDNRVYSCPSTCASSINKIGGNYYLTSSIAHAYGSTKILTIDDPKKLYELTVDSLKHHCNWWTQFTSGYDYENEMKKFYVGTQKLVELYGIVTLTSFEYNSQLYHINYCRENLFISKIQGEKLIYLDSIPSKPIFSDDQIIQKQKNIILYVNKSYRRAGFITVKNDTISIVTLTIRRKS